MMSERQIDACVAGNLWLRRPIAENPYERTAFRVARVSRETTRRGAIVQAVSQTRQLVAADPKAHAIRERVVSPGEINKAEVVLLDARRRILEELLHHATERIPLGPIQKAAQQLAAFRPDAEAEYSDDGKGRDLVADSDADIQTRRLRLPAELAQFWAAQLAAQFLEQVGKADPGFGARELEIVPPFYNPDEEA